MAEARADEAPPPEAHPTRGAAVGRFLVLDELGAGGMGVVVRAYDPDLDRRVAIKLLRVDRGGDAEASVRMVREAQAMARLAHPHVVPVYEVGSWQGRGFVVMELVDGVTLTAWLTAARRDWREVVAMFVGAGDGLAAAHAARLVHRDFKPENVLVGRDGRARVTDFGLVGLRHDGDIEAPGDEDAAALTLTGALVGTPRYMAPEQHRREPATPRSDQFAFCVALWQALYGAPPFAGDSYRELARNVLAGTRAAVPRDAAVPAHVRRALDRGLALDPAQRFADMPALLAELRFDPDAAKRRRGRLAAGVGVVLLSAATLALAWPRAPTAPPPPALALLCRGAADELAEAWDDAARARLGTALRGAGPRGAQVWAAVEPQLDAYAAAWVEMRTDACEATRLRGEQSEPLLDLRVACLDRRRDELRALVAELVPLGPSDPDRVAQAVPRLTGLGGCADVAALTAPVPPPTDPAVRARVDEFTTQLARLKARADTGQYAEVAAEGAPLLATLQELGYLPRYAEACLLVGEARAQAGDLDGARAALADATWAAEAARHDAVAARAWTVLTFVAGFSAGDAAAGAVAARRADAAVRRLGDPAEPRGRLELNLGAIAYGSGDVDGAIAHWERALALWTAANGANHPDLARVHNNLGAAYGDRGDHARAIAAYDHALAIWEPTLGDGHPLVGIVLQNLAAEQMTAGGLDGARAVGERALAITERRLGVGHAQVAVALKTTSAVAIAQGRLDDAARELERAREIDRAHGGDQPWTLIKLADVRRAQGRLRLARELAGAALAAVRAGDVVGAQHVHVGIVLGVLAEIELDAGAAALAARLAEDAIADLEKNLGERAQQLAQPLAVLGRARIARRAATWRAPLDRALALLGAGDPLRRAEIERAIAAAPRR
ncbi:MAG: serine/threonine protein kinase [Myxococcales bacterium]|nr:serine/threonine protein kinase [Myxococcales bacterium]